MMPDLAQGCIGTRGQPEGPAAHLGPAITRAKEKPPEPGDIGGFRSLARPDWGTGEGGPAGLSLQHGEGLKVPSRQDPPACPGSTSAQGIVDAWAGRFPAHGPRHGQGEGDVGAWGLTARNARGAEGARGACRARVSATGSSGVYWSAGR
jgi:hypothetical protein